MNNKKCAVFILLGQSNASGHAVPMAEQDYILSPLKNVFGLSRERNQTFENTALTWSGYKSGGMNLGEDLDHTYSLANCLAASWQTHIDGGNALRLPDLYIVQIAVGSQGVTEKYMWNPEKTQKLVPGRLGVADISLFLLSEHVFSLLDQSFKKAGKDYEIIGLHWRGGEEDMDVDKAHLEECLHGIYATIFKRFHALLNTPPTVLHRLVCDDRTMAMSPSGRQLANMEYINSVFEALQEEYPNVSVFDARCAPQYDANVRGNDLFTEDLVHFTKEVNTWVADCVIKEYANSH